MESLYQTESFLTACISLVHEPDKPWSSQQPSCTNSRRELRRNCSPIGHYNTKHFLCPIRSQHSLDLLEMVRLESVPRGFSACDVSTLWWCWLIPFAGVLTATALLLAPSPFLVNAVTDIEYSVPGFNMSIVIDVNRDVLDSTSRKSSLKELLYALLPWKYT